MTIRKQCAKSLFLNLLVFLKNHGEPVFEVPVNPVIDKVIRYVNENIGKPLTVQQIAKEMYISESYLAHVFKKNMNIPIYRYILEKRIFLADSKIKANTPVMQAAKECGFQDYSGFYKLYKKTFGSPPKGKKEHSD